MPPLHVDSKSYCTHDGGVVVRIGFAGGGGEFSEGHHYGKQIQEAIRMANEREQPSSLIIDVRNLTTRGATGSLGVAFTPDSGVAERVWSRWVRLWSTFANSGKSVVWTVSCLFFRRWSKQSTMLAAEGPRVLSRNSGWTDRVKPRSRPFDRSGNGRYCRSNRTGRPIPGVRCP